MHLARCIFYTSCRWIYGCHLEGYCSSCRNNIGMAANSNMLAYLYHFNFIISIYTTYVGTSRNLGTKSTLAMMKQFSYVQFISLFSFHPSRGHDVSSLCSVTTRHRSFCWISAACGCTSPPMQWDVEPGHGSVAEGLVLVRQSIVFWGTRYRILRQTQIIAIGTGCVVNWHFQSTWGVRALRQASTCQAECQLSIVEHVRGLDQISNKFYCNI